MRIARLQLPAYGHFKDKQLDFGESPATDFHILYGTNEAGKSTLLHSITELLYGIHLQSRAKFRYGPKVQIQATLEQPGLEPLDFLRRVKKDAPIATPEGEPLPESALAPFLHGLGKDTFESSFGISHDRLRAGGDELNEGKGDLGQALLSASGIEGIRPLLEQTRAQLRELLSSAKTAPGSIPALKNQYEGLLSELYRLEDEQSAEDFGTLCRQLAEAGEAHQAAREKEKVANNQVARLSRIKSALAGLRPYLDRKAALEAFPNPRCLPSASLDSLEQLLAQEAQTQEAVQKAEIDLQALQKRRDAIQCNPATLGLETQIAQARDQASLAENRDAEISALGQEAKALRENLTAQMANLSWEAELDTIPDFAFTDLQAQVYLELIQNKADQDRETQELEARIQELEITLANQGDAANVDLGETFASALANATKAQTLAGHAAKESKLLETRLDLLQGQAQGLPYIDVQLEGLPALKVPPKSVVQDFEEQYSHAVQAVQDANQAKEQADKALSETKSKLETELKASGQADPGLVQAAREYRDKGWELVLQDWKGEGAEEELEPGVPLETSFVQAIEAADHAADELFVHAGQAGRIQQLRDDVSRQTKTAKSLDKPLQEAWDNMETLQQGWYATWEPLGIEPGTPENMLEWIAQLQGILQAYTEYREKEAALRHDLETIATATGDIATALGNGTEGQTLDDLLTRANRVQESKRLVQETRCSLQSTKEKLQNAQTRQSVTQAKWETFLGELGMDPATSTAHAKRTIEASQKLFAGYNQFQTLQKRLAALKEEASAYASEVGALATKIHGADLFPGAQPAQTAKGLGEQLKQALESQSRAKVLDEQISEKQTALEKDKVAQASATGQLEEACQFHHCEDAAALRVFLQEERHKLSIHEKLEESREFLGQQALGQPLEEFIAELETHQGTIEQDLMDADFEATELRNASDQAGKTKNSLEIRHSDYGKDNGALEKLRLQLGSLEAEISNKAQTYAKLAWQEHFLTGAIQKAREASGGSLLRNAGKLFATLTEGAYLRLDTETEEKTGQARLVGIRLSDNLEEPVHPHQMSDGTRDQMYLALRLAWLQENLPRTPMPVVLDDLLINFDDHRSKAILQVLANLAKTTKAQILLFTHHYHVLELAREVLEECGDFQFQDITQDPGDPF